MPVDLHLREIKVSSLYFYCPKCGTVNFLDPPRKNDHVRCHECPAEFKVTEVENYLFNFKEISAGEMKMIPPLEKKIEESLSTKAYLKRAIEGEEF